MFWKPNERTFSIPALCGGEPGAIALKAGGTNPLGPWGCAIGPTLLGPIGCTGGANTLGPGSRTGVGCGWAPLGIPGLTAIGRGCLCGCRPGN